MNKVLIFPGFSIKNKDWAENTQKELSKEFNCEVVYWPHWETGEKEERWIEKEAEKIIKNNSGPISIIAKSIGTAVASRVVESKPELVEKLVLCGIPLNDLEEGEEKVYNSLRKLQSSNILCIQNTNDPHGSFEEVKKVIANINPKIRILSKDRDDHEYPYSEDFIDFLT